MTPQDVLAKTRDAVIAVEELQAHGADILSVHVSTTGIDVLVTGGDDAWCALVESLGIKATETVEPDRDHTAIHLAATMGSVRITAVLWIVGHPKLPPFTAYAWSHPDPEQQS